MTEEIFNTEDSNYKQLLFNCKTYGDDISNLYKVDDPQNIDSYTVNSAYYFQLNIPLQRYGYIKCIVFEIRTSSSMLGVKSVDKYSMNYCIPVYKGCLNLLYIMNAYVLDNSPPAYVLQ